MELLSQDNLVLFYPLHAFDGGKHVVLHYTPDLLRAFMNTMKDPRISVFPYTPHDHARIGIPYGPEDGIDESMLVPVSNSLGWEPSDPVAPSEHHRPPVPNSCREGEAIQNMSHHVLRAEAQAALGWANYSPFLQVLPGEDPFSDNQLDKQSHLGP